MSISFTRAPTVAEGDPITSTQLRKLADAFNDRLRSGLGDGAWRIVYYWLSLFRQVRNSDENGELFPAMAEFFSAGYQMLAPDRGNWPEIGPGQPEGSNLACQIMAYVFGAEAIDLYDEASRLGIVPLGPADTDEDLWKLAKQQRGGFDPNTGALGSPAWSAARAHYRIAMSPRSPHGNAYGGYLPTAELKLDSCAEAPDGSFPPNYDIFFTKLANTESGSIEPDLNYGVQDDSIVYNSVTYNPGETLLGVEGETTFTGSGTVHEQRHYAGTCIGEQYPGHVKWIGYAPWAYYVLKNDNSMDVLPTAEYIEGPYTGEAVLRKTANGALPRMLNAFAAEYRGSDAQRAVFDCWNDEAFDTQRFLTSQYHLAANIGTEEDGEVIPEYPLFVLSGQTFIASGTRATHSQSNTDHHAWAEGFVLSAFFASATALRNPITLQIRNGETLLQTVTLTPDEFGYAARLITLNAITPASLTVTLVDDAYFTSTAGQISVECNEILSQKPGTEDLFLVLRLGGALSADAVTDGRGIDDDQARVIGENYFSAGCITNVHGAEELALPDAAVNVNGVFDAARRLSQCIRIIPRQNFVGYAVENGKSVCWFTSTAQIGTNNVGLFGKIAGYHALFDFNGVTRASTTKHAYAGTCRFPANLTPGELLGLPTPQIGIITEDGAAFITAEDGTVIRTEDQPPQP
jgi:hypothetical protein